MKSQLSQFDIPRGCFPEAYGFRLFDEAIDRMTKEGIPSSEYEKVMEDIHCEVEERDKKIATSKEKAGKVKSRSRTSAAKPRPEMTINPEKESTSPKTASNSQSKSKKKISGGSKKSKFILGRRSPPKATTRHPK